MMTMATGSSSSAVDWESEVEMQRLLAMLPDIQPPSSYDDGTTTHGHGHVVAPLEFDLESEWDLERSSTSMMMGTGVGVF
jgi:hypothetical protein